MQACTSPLHLENASVVLTHSQQRLLGLVVLPEHWDGRRNMEGTRLTSRGQQQKAESGLRDRFATRRDRDFTPGSRSSRGPGAC